MSEITCNIDFDGEAIALREAFNLAVNLNFERLVVVESDAKVLINSYKGKRQRAW